MSGMLGNKGPGIFGKILYHNRKVKDTEPAGFSGTAHKSVADRKRNRRHQKKMKNQKITSPVQTLG